MEEHWCQCDDCTDERTAQFERIDELEAEVERLRKYGTEWLEAEKLADEEKHPRLFEAMASFEQDPTLDNSVGVIMAVLEAALNEVGDE